MKNVNHTLLQVLISLNTVIDISIFRNQIALAAKLGTIYRPIEKNVLKTLILLNIAQDIPKITLEKIHIVSLAKENILQLMVDNNVSYHLKRFLFASKQFIFLIINLHVLDARMDISLVLITNNVQKTLRRVKIIILKIVKFIYSKTKTIKNLCVSNVMMTFLFLLIKKAVKPFKKISLQKIVKCTRIWVKISKDAKNVKMNIFLLLLLYGHIRHVENALILKEMDKY